MGLSSTYDLTKKNGPLSAVTPAGLLKINSPNERKLYQTMNRIAQDLKESKPDYLFVINDETDLTGLPDDIYPFAGHPDQWVVIIDEVAVNWAQDWGVAVLMWIDALRVKREHAQRCPADIPFVDEPLGYSEDDELIFTSSAGMWPDDLALEQVRL